ncbi:MAG: hypothetical protein A4E63_02019 [Syntrophorhabdus sp. PtaU1.Bin050]|nr:MAG: hypothetical protein A4E63_02019 [Syntrophorhabdus sp. PtaU1.Bin050]
MGKEQQATQGQTGRFKQGIGGTIGQALMDVKAKIMFVADCVASGDLEFTEDGWYGFYMTLRDIAQEIDNAVLEQAGGAE